MNSASAMYHNIAWSTVGECVYMPASSQNLMELHTMSMVTTVRDMLYMWFSGIQFQDAVVSDDMLMKKTHTRYVLDYYHS